LTEYGRCPVCQARFRGTRICSRCGADLHPLMLLAAKSWKLREAARCAIAAGDTHRALALSNEAEQLHRTPQGKALQALCNILE
jgi:predicted amidophosphoribosyltransferase